MKIMKNVKSALFIAVIAMAQACNSGDSTDSVKAANDANDNKDSASIATKMDTATTTANTKMNTTPVDKDDADFAVKAANGGMMEVELGNYAQQNAISKRVKDFGAMMVKDHTKANEELKSLAAAKNITLPTSIGNDAQKNMDDLMKKKGNDFDKAYMNMMVDDHKKDVKEFEMAAKDCKDAEIKSFAGKTLPILLAHLDSTKAITGKK
jgi:putative membrane protein